MFLHRANVANHTSASRWTSPPRHSLQLRARKLLRTPGLPSSPVSDSSHSSHRRNDRGIQRLVNGCAAQATPLPKVPMRSFSVGSSTREGKHGGDHRQLPGTKRGLSRSDPQLCRHTGGDPGRQQREPEHTRIRPAASQFRAGRRAILRGCFQGTPIKAYVARTDSSLR